MKLMKMTVTSSNKIKPHAVNGILLLNKPTGMTSNAVLQRVKRLYQAQKAGHTGSLDPLATGMLPLCFGEATKFSQYLLDADKCYRVEGLLGIKTNSGDATGEIINQCHEFDVSLEALQQVLKQFQGAIMQVPSMFSALKHQGKPLYHYARQGKVIDRAARPVSIYDLQINHFDGLHMDLTVTCSKGTYIRNLIEDIGEQLATGAHVTKLDRLYTAGLANETMYTLEQLAEQDHEALLSYLLPMERAVDHLPKIILEPQAINALYQGKTTDYNNPSAISGDVQLFTVDQQCAGIGELQVDGVLKAKRLLSNEYFLSSVRSTTDSRGC